MRKIVCFLLMFLMGSSLMAEPRKKVGVVLSGGGSRGMAHIGVLKVLEEAGIPIDYVVGTSMGAIVGGLYSIGYSAEAIDSMVQAQDWNFLLSDKVLRNSQSFPAKESSEKYILSLPFGKEKKDRMITSVIKGQSLYNLFSDLTIGYHDSVDFNTFKTPFACVAVDAVNGKEYVFHKGSLPLAMRASMAIPAVFSPVRLDSMMLIDGGLNNNFPVDVARAMGAEIIIGVDVLPGKLKTMDELASPPELIEQIVTLYSYDKYRDNIAHSDVLIRPDVITYNSANFAASALDSMIHRGERAAREHWSDLQALKKRIGLADDYVPQPSSDPSRTVSATDTFYIRHISFVGVDPRDEKWLKKLCGLHEESYITRTQLQKAMSILVGTNAYANVSYKLAGVEGRDLILSVQNKSISSLNLGLRFDTEEIVAVQLNATLDYRARNHSRLAFTGRVGRTSQARLDYTLDRTPLRNINLAYMFSYRDLDIYEHGTKKFNTAYRHHLVEVSYSDMNWMNFKFQVGARYEYFDYSAFLYTDQVQDYQVKPEGFISYFAQAHLETLDRRYFPSRGVSLKADYSFYTDNFVTYNGSSPFSAVSLS
ncbi:MAG: patatin-like phospholipase family protein, partial [Tannerellaceae bacterium]